MKIKCLILAIAGCVCVCNAYAIKHCVVLKCDSGYYVSSGVSDIHGDIFYTSCVRCPAMIESDGTRRYGTTPVGLSKKTDCAIPVGTYKKSNGNYKFTSPCKYVN